MSNYISINKQNIALTEEQVKQFMEAFGIQSKQKRLAEFSAGETVRIGDYELIVLEQFGEETALILKDLYEEEVKFDEENNNYLDSCVDEKCQEFANQIAEIIGLDNLVLHTVDLTSDDGLKDYGSIERRASLITTEMYRRYVDILDKFNPKQWWWLATPHSTKRHDNDSWVKCVSPSGYINNLYYYGIGVRPFCILKSTIFVSM